jgi:DNA invertase Pin-like site-specific DNA recombinase
MFNADGAPRAPSLAGNRSQRRQPEAVPVVPVTALGYLSVRAPAHRDPELSDQEAAIQEFCARRGWTLVAITVDVESPTGRGLGRPSLTHAIERLRRGDADCLVVAHIARLCPSVAELGGIIDAVEHANARLVSLEPPLDTGTQVGHAKARLLTGISAWERTRRSAMTSAARAKVDPPTAIRLDVKRRIVRLRGAGMTLQAIADELNDDGIPTVRGGAKWRPSSVQAALGYKRPRPWATPANGLGRVNGRWKESA